MRTRLNVGLWSLLVLNAIGCQGLTPGSMEWVQPASQAPRAGNVYLIRGLVGVFSTGMDDLGSKIEQNGVRARVFQDNQNSSLAQEIVKKYKGVKNPEPLVLIGHSYGADDVMRIAHVLNDNGIKIDLAITVDATVPPTVPPNVQLCYNYYQSQPTDVIPMFRGIPLKEEKPGMVKLVNMDLRKDRTDLLESGTNHINIDKNVLLHGVVVKEVLDACPQRDVWVVQHGGNLDNARQASDRSSPQSSAPSRAATGTYGTTDNDKIQDKLELPQQNSAQARSAGGAILIQADPAELESHFAEIRAQDIDPEIFFLLGLQQNTNSPKHMSNEEDYGIDD